MRTNCGFCKYSEIASVLDEDSLKGYNAYVAKYLVNDRSSAIVNTNSTDQASLLPTTSREDRLTLILNQDHLGYRPKKNIII